MPTNRKAIRRVPQPIVTEVAVRAFIKMLSLTQCTCATTHEERLGQSKRGGNYFECPDCAARGDQRDIIARELNCKLWERPCVIHPARIDRIPPWQRSAVARWLALEAAAAALLKKDAAA
jgi:hypothetical protein